MRVALAFLAFLAGCGPGLPSGGELAQAQVEATPVRREASFGVVPAELGDEAAVDRIRHRVRVKRIGRAWLRLDLPPINDDGGGRRGGGGDDDDEPTVDELMPAIGETANRIRVVTEEDSARVAVWLDRRDAWESIVAPVKLEGDAAGARTGGAGAATGAWLAAGAPVTAARARVGGARRVELRDDAVELQGTVPAAFLGHVWIVPHDDRTRTDIAGYCTRGPWHPPADDRMATLAEHVVIRAAPGDAAPALATVREPVEVVVLARDASWAEVELRRPYARVRGHVPAGAIDEDVELGSLSSICGGRGFGMSSADRIDVPAGACLYDRANGDVVGVATEAKTRLGRRGRAGDAWSMVYVDTRWSVASLYVRDTGRDPAQPALESCAPERPRR